MEDKIVYKNVDFRYPTRRSVQVLENLNLEIEKGKTVALVGPSGEYLMINKMYLP